MPVYEKKLKLKQRYNSFIHKYRKILEETINVSPKAKVVAWWYSAYLSVVYMSP